MKETCGATRVLGATILALGLLPALAAGCGDGGEPLRAPRGYDARAYALRARFDWDARRLIASEDVTLVLADGASPRVTLDSSVTVERVHAGGGDLPFTADPVARTLEVDLSSLGGAGKELTFTIEYEAGTSSALIASSGRDGDPVTSRVVFTDSEPDRGRAWLVANHRPDDRARFKVELTVGDGEDVVANGDRMVDMPAAGGGRLVGYELADPIPTYIMAFAAGELVHADGMAGDVPLAIWHRRGLAVDTAANLTMLAGMVDAFEALVGPYPWPAYAVVLLPEMPGGMENAGITFNVETSGQGYLSRNLNAHELAHQWFGDWVTVETFDDIWFKEGMATLLASEADRARRDLEGKGRLFGFDFSFDPADSIRDTSLTGLDRYTSGPYSRSAWMLTQLRAKLGDAAFFAALRDVLEEHGRGTIDSEGFIDAFGLDAATRRQALAALDQKAVPQVTITRTGEAFRFEVQDPGGTLLVPIEVTVVDGAGAATTNAFAAGMPLEVTVPADGYLAIDERDVHPYLTHSFDVQTGVYGELVARYVPPSGGAAEAAFLTRSAGAQEKAFWARSLADDVTPASFGTLHDGLDSLLARRYVEVQACRRLKADASWSPAATPFLEDPALETFSTGYSGCGVAVAEANFAAELARLAAAATPVTDAARLAYLASYDYGTAGSLAALIPVATSYPSLQVREVALTRLSYQAEPGYGYEEVPEAELGAWRTFFRDQLAPVRTFTRLRIVWRGLRGLRDAEGLPLMAAKLHVVPMGGATQSSLVCEAAGVAAAPSAAWDAFREAAKPWTELTTEAQAVLADPSTCE